MSTYVYAYWEILKDTEWCFYGQFKAEAFFDFAVVPENIAPESWGKYNFRVYYEASGAKGLPMDMSKELKSFIDGQWDYVNRPSWMTLAEIIAFYKSDTEARYAHIDFESMLNVMNLPDNEVRLVFWADQ